MTRLIDLSQRDLCIAGRPAASMRHRELWRAVVLLKTPGLRPDMGNAELLQAYREQITGRVDRLRNRGETGDAATLMRKASDELALEAGLEIAPPAAEEAGAAA